VTVGEMTVNKNRKKQFTQWGVRGTKIATKLFETHNKIKLWSVEISITMSGTKYTRGDTLDEAEFSSWNKQKKEYQD
jgi:hypothetical protein